MPRRLTDEDIIELREKYSDLLNYSSKSVLDPIDPWTYRDSDGDSILHIAVLRDDIETAIMLLSAGFDSNVMGDMGSTPLHYACEEPRNDKMIELLLAHGARTDIVDELGNRPKL